MNPLVTQKKQTLSEKVVHNFMIFGKTQVAAFLGGIADYIIMIILTEVIGLFYTYGVIIGGIIGGMVNFSVNKFWTFKSIQSSFIISQILKFSLMTIGSIVLKTIGTYLFTETIGIDYKFSRLITDTIVCFCFNYLIQRYWVFKNQ